MGIEERPPVGGKPDDTWILPFHPEALDQLRRRYPRALRPLFDCRTGRPRPQPHELYSCLFDWPDGLRLIVSRKLVRLAVDGGHEDATYLFFSALAFPGTVLAKLIAKNSEPNQEPNLLYRTARAGFVDLSGDTKSFDFMGFNQRDMPHWRRRLETAA